MKKWSNIIGNLLFGKVCLKYEKPGNLVFELFIVELVVLALFFDFIITNVFVLKLFLYSLTLIILYFYLLVDYKQRYIKIAFDSNEKQEVFIKKNKGVIKFCYKVDTSIENYEIMILPKKEFAINVNYLLERDDKKIRIKFQMIFHIGYEVDLQTIYDYFNRFSKSNTIDICKILSERIHKIMKSYDDIIFNIEENSLDETYDYFHDLVVDSLNIEKLGISTITYS